MRSWSLSFADQRAARFVSPIRQMIGCVTWTSASSRIVARVRSPWLPVRCRVQQRNQRKRVSKVMNDDEVDLVLAGLTEVVARIVSRVQRKRLIDMVRVVIGVLLSGLAR